MIHRLQSLILVALIGALAGLPNASVSNDPVRDAQWHLDYLNIEEAHRYSQGEGITVAVLDTGIDADHPDLDGAAVGGADFTHEASPDGLVDTDGHGTAMAGIIAADGRALGIAPAARVQSVRIKADKLGGGSLRDAIVWASTNGAAVMCIAVGPDEGDVDLDDAISNATIADVVIVAAAGNRPGLSHVGYPGTHPSVVAVSGVDKAGEFADVSVSGRQVLLAAPAVDIVSTDIRSEGHTGYGTGSGTSNAAAIVAGAAALVRSKYPELSAAEVIHRLTATADDKGPPGRDSQYGYGVINIVRALTEDVPPPTPSTDPIASTPLPTEATPPEAGENGLDLLPIAGIAILLLAAAGFVVWLVRRPA